MRSEGPPEAAAFGVLVADVFCGEFPRTGPAVLRLPSVIRLPVLGDLELPGDVETPDQAEELQFLPPPAAVIPESLSRVVVTEELAAALSAEAERLKLIATRAAAHRATARAALREAHHPSPSVASVFHERLIQTSERRSHPLPQTRSSISKAARKHVRMARAPKPQVIIVPAQKRPRRLRARFRFRESLRVGIGALAFGGLFASLASFGDLPRIARHVETIAGRGTAALTKGVHSLLVADTRAGTRDFTQALSEFQEALRQLNHSTTLLQRIAARMDPQARLEAARTLLTAGERSAALGVEVTKIVELFQREGKETLTETLEAALPGLTRLEVSLSDVLKDLGEVERASLPEDAVGNTASLRQILRVLQRSVRGFLASHAVVLELLGSRHDRQYLVMFQNNRELRPTGGFIGSFALLDVSQGEVRKVRVDTIYNPDGQLKDFLVPPVPLQKITDRWFTRDANWFADFRVSASKVAHLFERSGGPTVDGVLAVTPDVLADLLRLTGPIPMPDYGVTITADNVTEETQRLVTYEYDRERNEPKAFIADLMPEVLNRITAMPRERWGELMETFVEALTKKHFLVYFRNEEAEAAVVQLGWGGALPELPQANAAVLVDHLGRVEANIGGHKTDTLIEQSVEHEVLIGPEGSANVTLVVTRHHRGSKAGSVGVDPAEDPAQKTNIVYERTFVPLGSELLEARGFTKESDVPSVFANAAAYAEFLTDGDVTALQKNNQAHASGLTIGTESGFTTLGGWVVTRPEETTVTVLRYRLPFQLPRPSLLASILRYELLLSHQPGHLPILTRSSLRVPEGFRISWAGPTTAVTNIGEQKATFAALTDRDLTWGAVLEEK